MPQLLPSTELELLRAQLTSAKTRRDQLQQQALTALLNADHPTERESYKAIRSINTEIASTERKILALVMNMGIAHD